MNREVTCMLLQDDLDMHLYKKPLKDVLETYAGFALGELLKNNPEQAKVYITRLLLVLRGNCNE